LQQRKKSDWGDWRQSSVHNDRLTAEGRVSSLEILAVLKERRPGTLIANDLGIMMNKMKAFIMPGMLLSILVGVVSAEEGMVAQVGQSGEFLDFVQQESGRVIRDYIPLHRKERVSYFAAGVGLEERAAQYPLFSLKVVFTAGGKPFFAGVDVVIKAKEEGMVIVIPGEQVKGPWLFVDLPTGNYDISASQSGLKQELKGIKVKAGKQKTVYLRWADDPGLAVTFPGE
jgi:hypothetical protein